MLNFFKIKKISLVASLMVAAGLLSSCTDDVQFNEAQSSEYFVQAFNPAFVDILWVVDTRTPMRLVKENLLEEATKFFTQLDNETANYRMGFITPDVETSNGMGKLQPSNSSGLKVISKNFGTFSQRVQAFRNLFPTHTFNLSTGAENRGFEAAKLAIQGEFTSSSNVPLVLIFVSDGDDTSRNGDQEAYKNYFLGRKGNKSDLVRSYSINYTETGDRCATSQANTQTDFSDYGVKLFSESLGGELVDLCTPFASQLDYDAVRFRELAREFKLSKVPQNEALQVRVVLPGSGEVIEMAYEYRSATNSIVFDQTPPEGSRIEVDYIGAN